MASTNNEPYIKFTYFRDPISPRTVTAARMLDGDKMYVDWAVNRMHKADEAYAKDNYVPQWYGDIFVKSIARNIVKGRVLKRRNVVVLKGEERKLEQMIDYMLTEPPQFVRDIVKRACEARLLEEAERVLNEAEALNKAKAESASIAEAEVEIVEHNNHG